jgi:hypothetical protein
MMSFARGKVLFALGLIVAALVMGLGSAERSRAEEKKTDVKNDDPAVPKPTPEQQKRIDELIKQLGADRFEDREQAQKELVKIGPAALERLRLATKSPEAEIRRRVADLIGQLEDVLKTGKQLAPKKVHLKLKDISVVDAVADLSKQSGYPIQIDGDKAKLAQRKLTLDTGEISFWEAFDQLNQQGGLVEAGNDGKAVGSLHVADGTPTLLPTAYAGAVRVRIVPDSIKRKDGVVEMLLEMAIEPRFRQPRVLGAARVDTALDEKGQAVVALEKPEGKATATRAPAALKLDGRQQTLKELSGVVLFETVLADKVLIIDDVSKNVGKSVTNDEGSILRLDSYAKQPNGDVRIQASLTKTLAPGAGGRVVIGGDVYKEFPPELRDGNGLSYQKGVVNRNSISVSSNNNNTTVSISQTLTYHPQPGCGEAAELAVTSDKQTALNVPFSFKNLKLP